MRSLLLVPMLALSAAASAGEVTVGVAGGVVAMDPLEVLGPTWTVVPRVGYFFRDEIGLELDVGVLSGDTRIGPYPYTALTPRINMVGRLWTQGKRNPDGTFGKAPPVQPLLTMGIGGLYRNVSDDNELGDTFTRQGVDLLLNAGPGAMVQLTDNVHLRTDVRWMLTLGDHNFRLRGSRFINWEWTAGVGVNFGKPKDRDGDGIVDKDDQCPAEAEDVDGFEDADGCPDLDNDGDGIPDTEDQCPNEAEDMDGFEDADGCPDLDNDGDGIPDVDDACPDEFGHESGGGCPDPDGDTVLDGVDECPDEPGPVESFGCVDVDGDRVPDYRDECPEEAGPPDADPLRSDGCPTDVYVTADEVKITEKVFFDTGKSTIQRKSHALLDRIVATLEANPSIKRLEIDGHTDNTGDHDANVVLSQARADAVLAYFVDKGIEAERLLAKGFGPDKPKVDGPEADTDEGRAMNRRVEFRIIEQDEEPVHFERKALQTALHELTFDGMELKVAHLPVPGSVRRDGICEATLTVGIDGAVSDIEVHGCNGMPRSVTRRSLKMWEFVPFVVDGEAKPHKVTFKVYYKDGNATAVSLVKNSLQPVE